MLPAITSVIMAFILLLFAFALLGGAFFIVPQQHAYVIERLGRFHRIAAAGFHAKIPIIDHIVQKVDLKVTQTGFPIDVKTADNVIISLDVAVQYCVSTDHGIETNNRPGIYRAVYLLNSPVAQMTSYITDSLRSAVPTYDLDAVFSEKDAIASKVKSDISALMIDYGFDITNVLITSINLPKDLEMAMNEINTSLRRRDAAQNNADADKIVLVTNARAKAEAMEQEGKGIALQRKAIAEGIKDSLKTIEEAGVTAEEADELFRFTQWADMMEAFANSGVASTVVLPSDFDKRSVFEQMAAANAAFPKE